MSDPLSITASVAGLVSLGVQVVGGLTQYLDAVRGRKDDIAKAKTQVHQMKELLRLVESVAAKVGPTHDAPAAFLKASASIKSELKALEDCVRDVDSANLLLPKSKLIGKFCQQAKKLTYPFHRPTLDRLESRLNRVNITLLAALEVSILDVAIDIERSNSAIETTLPDMALRIDAIRPLVQDTGRQLSEQFAQENVAGHHAISRVGDSVASLSSRFDHGILEIQEAVAANSSTSMTVLRRDYAHGHTRMLHQFAVSQSSVSELANTLSRVEMALRTLPTREELGRLISKPSQLKEWSDFFHSPSMDTVSMTTHRHSPITLGQKRCICRKHPTRSRKAVVWGSWRLFAEKSASHDHHPDCVYHIKGAEATSARYSVAFTGLQRLINRAIEVSFSYSFGAGGGSLGPNFTCYPSIDRRRDPAFRIMALMQWAQWMEYLGCTRKLNADDFPLAPARFMELCIENIIVLYRHGKASPKAVDLYGRGILHYFGFLCKRHTIYTNSNPRRDFKVDAESVLAGLGTLIEYGGQATVYDIYGSTPAWNFNLNLVVWDWDSDYEGCYQGPGDPSHCDSSSLLSDFLCSQQSYDSITYSPLNEQPFLWGFLRPIEFLGILQRSSATAEACGCGPLSLAALEGNLTKMIHLLTNYPNAVDEVNLFKQTPLHLAVGHSSCVALLLGGSGRKLIDMPDSDGRRPMGYALHSCLTSERRGYVCDDGCENLGGNTSLTILLEADCMIPRIASWPSYSGFDNQFLCDNCIRAISPHLVNRRERLKKLAIDNLPRLQAVGFDLFSPSVLDSNATKVIQSLSKRGVSVPIELQVPGIDYIYIDCNKLSSSYHGGSMPFPVLWSLGFRDLDTPDADGMTPLTLWSQSALRRSSSHFKCEKALGACSWLIENGADLWNMVPYKVYRHGHWGSTIGHELYSRIGDISGQITKRPAKALVFHLTEKLLQINPRDSCHCACSPGGCTPFARFLQATLERGRTDNDRSASGLSDFITKVLMDTHTTITTDQMRSAMRLATFEMLGIRHTCGFEIGNTSLEQNNEEHDQFRQEDRFLTDHLEDLIEDFEKLLEQLGKKRHSKRCVKLLFDGWWLSRMEQVLECIDRGEIDESTKKTAEDIGVVWHKEEPGKDEDIESEYDTYDKSSPASELESGQLWLEALRIEDDWISRLDFIMSEAGLPR